MQATALNTIAIGVFLLTISSLVSPMLNVSPTIPAAIAATILSLITIDTFRFQNRGATLFLSFFASKEQRERVLHHEAGHFLAAYFLGIPIIGYSLTPWEGIKQGQNGIGGTVFDFDVTRKEAGAELALSIDRFATVLMAGIAAETIVFGNAAGGEDDRQKLRQTLGSLGLPAASYQQKEKWSQLQASNLIDRHRESYQALVAAMQERKSVADCYQILQNSLDRT